MLNQYSRTQLLFGADGMEKLRQTRVAVFGIGGVGGYTVEALSRSGIGTLDLIDDDRVCLTNINRQIFATRKTVGQYKVDVAEQRVLEIDPDITVNTYKMFYTPQTADQCEVDPAAPYWLSPAVSAEPPPEPDLHVSAYPAPSNNHRHGSWASVD